MAFSLVKLGFRKALKQGLKEYRVAPGGEDVSLLVGKPLGYPGVAGQPLNHSRE